MKKYYWGIGAALLCIFWGTGCTRPVQETPASGFASVRNEILVDSLGRELVLNGINHVTKSPEDRYVYPNDEQLFKEFRNWGINCIRYGINWDGLEPEPGQYNENYLQEIDRRVRWAEENGIYLILDMHQDLFGRKFGNGAPEWATLDESLPHATGEVWSDSYLISPAVQKSFDNFWANSPAKDGTGIQDHYINVWGMLAERYADCKSVIGFDVMNEPFMGTQAQAVFQQFMEGYIQYLHKHGQTQVSPEAMTAVWDNEDQRAELMNQLTDKEAFTEILHAASETVSRFEQNELSRFYQKLRDRIRQADKNHLLFLEHNYFCNMGIKSSFHIPADTNGKPDSLCVYAAHAYDWVVDTDAAVNPGYERLDFIFSQLTASARERHLPALVGEWGAFYLGKSYLQSARHQIGLIEKYKLGHTYWCWWKDIETQDYFSSVISRPYPQVVNGQLLSYSSTNGLTCQWKEDKTSPAPTLIFLPDLKAVSPEQIRITPESSWELIPLEKGSKAGFLSITPTGTVRSLQLK